MELKNNSNLLFKYMPFDLNAIKIFINNELWFGEPDIQNDPNEIEFIMDYDEKNIYEFVSHTFNFGINKELEQEIEKQEQGSNNEFEKSLKKNIKDYVGICSMSKKFNDILMWSHYADSNKGICIVFSKEKLINYFVDKNRVQINEDITYTKELPHAIFNKVGMVGRLQLNKDFFSHKFTNWEYEDEYRFVKTYKNSLEKESLNRLQYFPADTIEGVIIGECFSKINLKTLKNLFSKKAEYKDLKFWISKNNIREQCMKVELLK